MIINAHYFTSYMQYVSPDGWDIDLPNFTCVHCGCVYSPSPKPDHRSREDVAKAINRWMDDYVEHQLCLSCDALVCKYCQLQCTPLLADSEKAHVDLHNQSWLVRDADRDPVYKVFDADGNMILAKRRDVSYTEGQLANLAGEIARLKELQEEHYYDEG